MTKVFSTPFAKLTLTRYPKASHASLQAFDAADEYLLNELAHHSLNDTSKVLIINDNFGALACSLASHFVVDSSGDSYLAEQALYSNLSDNELATNSVRFIASTASFNDIYDVILIRVPKTLALLEEQLIKLQPHIHANTLILVAAMVKHLTKATNLLLDKILGNVQASLAIKKARLLKVTPQSRVTIKSPYPTRYQLTDLKLELINHANVFSRESLDIGARAFIPHLPQQLGNAQIADLGCGNGILGIICALNNPDAHLTFVDESYMAIASTEANWQHLLANRAATIKVADGLNEPSHFFDVILCNPPFHQQQVIGDFIAKQMFEQAEKVLKNQGELWVVGNRHLGYFPVLKKLFNKVQQITQTTKFIVWRAIK